MSLSADSRIQGQGGSSPAGLSKKALSNIVYSLVPKEQLQAEGPSIYMSGEGPYVVDHKGSRPH